MSAITFDTLAYSKKLRSVGFTEQQAEVAAEAQKETIEIVISELETRHLNDMATKIDLAEVKADLIRWVVAAGFLQTVLIAALLLKLIK
jgi:folate-dependent phosphoribosylglycinamide formyltransferase PurN